jgi:hypothetical protein
MDIYFANPAGFLALLGVPAVLAIHFLQRESRRVHTSTLFLLDNLAPVSAQGRRIERLRNSIPLWLQLLAVLLIAWLLVQPQWLRKDSSQTVVVVLDSSVSMRAFREEMVDALRRRLPTIGSAAARTEWILVESDRSRPTLHAGDRLDDLIARAAEWEPNLGTHDVRSALALARSLAGRGGVAIFVTDGSTSAPPGLGTIAVGRPIQNCGFVGVRVDGDHWTALVRNHGDTPQARKWSVAVDGAQDEPRTISLGPGEVVSLGGRLPADRFEIVLEADEFSLDDRLPIVREQRKPLALSLPTDGDIRPFFERIAESIPDTMPESGKSADIEFAARPPTDPLEFAGNAVVVVGDAGESGRYLDGAIVAENHPLVERLEWQGLIAREAAGIEAEPSDEVLLWQGTRPLILLRRKGDSRLLVVNFDLAQSNADRLPAFVVLLSRFAESVREGKAAFERRNLETNQTLPIPPTVVAGSLSASGAHIAGGVVRASAEPGFFEISRNGEPLLAGAAHFADAREADFRSATQSDTTHGIERDVLERNSREDLLTPVWALLLGAVCIASWAFTGRRST